MCLFQRSPHTAQPPLFSSAILSFPSLLFPPLASPLLLLHLHLPPSLPLTVNPKYFKNASCPERRRKHQRGRRGGRESGSSVGGGGGEGGGSTEWLPSNGGLQPAPVAGRAEAQTGPGSAAWPGTTSCWVAMALCLALPCLADATTSQDCRDNMANTLTLIRSQCLLSHIDQCDLFLS